jgi:hypothetical protein
MIYVQRVAESRHALESHVVMVSRLLEMRGQEREAENIAGSRRILSFWADGKDMTVLRRSFEDR